MGCLGCGLMGVGVPSWHHRPILASFCDKSEQTVAGWWFPGCITTNKSNQLQWGNGCLAKCSRRLRPPFALPDGGQSEVKEEEAPQRRELELGWKLLSGRIGNSGIVSSCSVGLLTGVAVVIFNNAVHEIRDLSWDGIPSRGASWLREEPIQATWTKVILVPALGGIIVALLKLLLSAVEENPSSYIKSAFQPFLKAVAACVTLGTGNSLGPEGPSVEIGTSIAKGVGSFSDKSSGRMLSLIAAGSAAGIASGFNAAVAGCFFAVESVLWPSPSPDASLSLTNTTSMVILSAVIASVVSEIGLGSEPAFRVPDYDFRSPGELPLYLLLGILCGLVSLTLSWCTSYMLMIVDNLHKATGISKASFPILGGVSVGLIALAYPEILYWGFENVDILLESRPFVKGLSTDLLLQLIGIKIIASSLCRASGLVGGYYAPSLFIGAATGMAYGKFIGLAVAESNLKMHLSVLEVASPQAYGLVGMAATLAGVCQVPLTAVLLLFELTQDYRIVLPLLGAVGLSSWISSVQKKRDGMGRKKLDLENSNSTVFPETSSFSSIESSTGYDYDLAESAPYSSDLCQIESSLCVEYNDNVETAFIGRRTFVSEAMKTRYVMVSMCTLLTEVLNIMLAEKQSCAVIVDADNTLIGLLTLRDIQEYGRFAKSRGKNPKELLVSELCRLHEGICTVPCTATPDMDLLSAQMTMRKHGVNQIPVVTKLYERAYPVGILDTDSIILTCSALATKESLGNYSTLEGLNHHEEDEESALT